MGRDKAGRADAKEPESEKILDIFRTEKIRHVICVETTTLTGGQKKCDAMNGWKTHSQVKLNKKKLLNT